eukprot:CAMPEP_0172884714 /NCGR_PEP_ID=MMETSP1075-20121228/126016_1 /TAXON_ID=2916 /ORGANISM="Ceratium fusus, Strain PA161109" /LENGTH=134 /DNA_ID=CAMNT_0013737859 /DNA_START=39 /DNA_END=443 /DNA_ORIENTATION=+
MGVHETYKVINGVRRDGHYEIACGREQDTEESGKKASRDCIQGRDCMEQSEDERGCEDCSGASHCCLQACLQDATEQQFFTKARHQAKDTPTCHCQNRLTPWSEKSKTECLGDIGCCCNIWNVALHAPQQLTKH